MADIDQTLEFFDNILETADVALIRASLQEITNALTPLTKKAYKWSFGFHDIVTSIIDIKEIVDGAIEYNELTSGENKENPEAAEVASRIVRHFMDVLSTGLNWVPNMTYPSLVLGIGQKVLEHGTSMITDHYKQIDDIFNLRDGDPQPNTNYDSLREQLLESGATYEEIDNLISALEALNDALTSSGVDTATFSSDLSGLRSFYNYAYSQHTEKYTDCMAWIDNIIDKSKNDAANAAADASNAPGARDPLIIDLGRKGIELTSVDNGVYFDLDNNGFAEKTAWIGTEDGFLALDRNGNGRIDNGGELFGDQVTLKNGATSASGFEALAELDDNEDGIINNNDSAFNDLCVWIDSNHNGISESNELKTLNELGIVSIDLNHTNINETDLETGTIVSESAVVTFAGGLTSAISEHWFMVNSHDTEELDILDGETITSVNSFGNVKSLNNAILSDQTGKLAEMVAQFKNSADYIEQRILLKQILYFITDSANLVPNSRGGNIDARDLHVIEQFMGRGFTGIDGGSSPNVNAAPILKDVCAIIENMYFNLLNKETIIGEYLYLIFEDTIDDGSGRKTLDLTLFNLVLASEIKAGENVDGILSGVGSWLYQYDKAFGTSVFNEFRNHFLNISENYANLIDNITIENVIIGTGGNDNLFGTDRDDIFDGLTGNDTLNGGAGDDIYIFEAGHGNDTIIDNSGQSKLVFKDGISSDEYAVSVNEHLALVLTNKVTGDSVTIQDYLSNPLNYSFDFSGASKILGGGGDGSIIQGTSGDDTISAGGGFNILMGGAGNDTIYGGDEMDIIFGGDGDDELYGANGTNIILGEAGDDIIHGGDDSSYLFGGDGDDTIFGGGSADTLDGGRGNDLLKGDHGDDTYIFRAGYGIDTIIDPSGSNTIRIMGLSPAQMVNTKNAQNDLIIDFAGTNDSLTIKEFFNFSGNRDFNFVFDNGTVIGQSSIRASYAPIYGTEGNDWLQIQGNEGGTIYGLGGDDGLQGGNGNDFLYGGNGNDQLYGNDGDDLLDGGAGNDILYGGAGSDTYIFANGYGQDTIDDWASGNNIVRFTDVNSDEVTVTALNGNALEITITGTTDKLTINNFKWGQASFIFEFADGATGIVDKNTFALELTYPETETASNGGNGNNISAMSASFGNNCFAGAYNAYAFAISNSKAAVQTLTLIDAMSSFSPESNISWADQNNFSQDNLSAANHFLVNLV